MKYLACAILAASAFCFVNPANSQSGGYNYTGAVIRNNMVNNVPITFYISWNNRPWQQYIVYPGHPIPIYWEGKQPAGGLSARICWYNGNNGWSQAALRLQLSRGPSGGWLQSFYINPADATRGRQIHLSQ